jgi:hypothetical protein
MNKRFIKVLIEAGMLPQSESLDKLRDLVSAALRTTACACDPTAADCQCPDGTRCACDDEYGPWIQDLFVDKVVYQQMGKLYQRDYTVSKGNVTFGAPIQVEVAYKPLSESHRVMAREAATTKAAKYDSSKGVLSIRVIEAGKNKSGSRYYPAPVLKRDHKIFEGAKMFANHQTEAEAKTRPEGDVNNWVASLTSTTWDESAKAVMGKVTVIDPVFKAKLDTLNENGLLPEMGVSIRAIGEAVDAEVDGERTNMVERFIAARSVDFVTYPGAGGRVEAMESDHADEFDADLMTEAQLRERRPDLVELIESNALARGEEMKTIEQQLKEAQDLAASEKKRADEATAKLQEAETATKKATASVELTRLLTESKLPEKAQAKLKKQFAEATEATGMAEAITEEKEYISSFAPATGVKGMGAGDNKVQESAEDKGKANLEEAFALLPGFSTEQAKIAARGR